MDNKLEIKRGLLGNKNTILILGLLLILIASVYIFTRKAFFEAFDLSQTGQIGDTIGGITAPIINIIGAFLVYMSFNAQIEANRIQVNLLNTELENRKFDRHFEITLDLFKQLKGDFNNLTYIERTGKLAINTFIKEIRPIVRNEVMESKIQANIFHDFYYILNTYLLILKRIEGIEMRVEEKVQLYSMIHAYYVTMMSTPCSVIEEKLKEHKTATGYLKLITNLKELHKTLEYILMEDTVTK